MTLEISPSAMSQLVGAIGSTPQKSNGSTYQATVLRTDSTGTTWVHIPGGAEETPVHASTTEVQPGDSVTVTIANGRATIGGNATSPSSTVRSVGAVRETAVSAHQIASDAADAAASALEDAAIARTAAASAQESADEAETAATAATTAAGNAQIAANAATFALSDVEKVVGTLEWITEHGEYELTEDTAVVAGKVYYTRSGTSPNYTYTVVAEPKTADIATYYELHMDESVQNYIASHLWLDSYGLNLSINGTRNYRIHQGTVDGTKTAGMYLLDSTSTIVAQFTASGFQVGVDGKSHLVGDYHSLQLVDGDLNVYFHVSDLRNESGIATITETFVAETSTTTSMDFTVTLDIYNTWGVMVVATGATISSWSVNGKTVTVFGTIPQGTEVSITYTTQARNAKAYTLGIDRTGDIGPLSFMEGYANESSGHASHAEGRLNVASGSYAHAEGYESVASGWAAHAEGRSATASGWASSASGNHTKAAGNSQTVVGRYNVEDTQDKYAFIIGNGSATTPSNAMRVGWNGITEVGALNTVGALNVGGNTTLSGTLEVASDATFSDDVRIVKKLDVDGNFEVDGNATVGRTLAVTGNVTCGTVNGVDVTAIPTMKSGVIATRSVAAGSSESVSVPFSGAFAAAPNVVCGLQSTQTQLMGNCSCVVTAKSTTGFTVALVNNSTSARNIGCYWIAM